MVYLQSASETYRLLCQVTNTKGYFVLGRDQAKHILALSITLQLNQPTCSYTVKTNLKTVKTDLMKFPEFSTNQ